MLRHFALPHAHVLSSVVRWRGRPTAWVESPTPRTHRVVPLLQRGDDDPRPIEVEHGPSRRQSHDLAH